jgi:hypothetical protein
MGSSGDNNKVVEMRAHGEKGFQIYCTTATLIGPDRQGADNHATDGVTSAIPRSSCER